MSIIGKALAHLGDSKTFILLLIMAILALLACTIAEAFGHDVWGSLFNFFGLEVGVGGGRTAVVDGAPKIAAAWRDPNSSGANPPPAVSTPIITSAGFEYPPRL